MVTGSNLGPWLMILKLQPSFCISLWQNGRRDVEYYLHNKLLRFWHLAGNGYVSFVVYRFQAPYWVGHMSRMLLIKEHKQLFLMLFYFIYYNSK